MVAMEATSVRFAEAARTLGQATRRRGLVVPGFRSPPRLRGADRSLRRSASGSCTVSVRLKGRPWSAVMADMIEGVVAANALSGPDADHARTALWGAVEADAIRLRGVGRVPPASLVGPDAAGSPPARRFPARRPGPAAASAEAARRGRNDVWGRPRPPRSGTPPLRAVPGGVAPSKSVPSKEVA